MTCAFELLHEVLGGGGTAKVGAGSEGWGVGVWFFWLHHVSLLKRSRPSRCNVTP